MSRITKEEALELFRNTNLIELGQKANAITRSKHPDRTVSFIVDRNINYTNICWVDCKFCAFYRNQKADDTYILSYEEIGQKIEELIDIGGTQILFQGGVHPKLKIDWYEDLVEYISTKYPTITIHGFSAVEIDYIAKISKLSYEEVFRRLNAKGLFSMPGAGAEILSDRVRGIISPKKLSTKQWLDVHLAAHKVGVKTTATMMFGSVESDEEIIEHLSLIRDLQDQYHGFRAFIAWSFQASNTKLLEEIPNLKPQSSNRYLRILAIARIFLDNFDNLQSSWVTQGSHIGQLSLMFGANDLGSTMMEENVVAAAGASNKMNQEQMIKIIKSAGLKPAKRNTAYEILQRF